MRPGCRFPEDKKRAKKMAEEREIAEEEAATARALALEAREAPRPPVEGPHKKSREAG